MRYAARVRCGRLLLALLLVGGLELACRAGLIARTTLIPPSAMAVALWELLASGALTADLAGTARNVASAVLLAVGVGLALGWLLAWRAGLRRLLDPLLTSYYAVPIFVFYPFFVYLFGMGDLPIVLMGALFATIAMAVTAMHGLLRVPAKLLKVAEVHRLSPAQRLRHVVLPSVALALVRGLKLTVAYSFIGVIAGEFILSAAGLGHRIAYAYNNFDNRSMYAVMLLVVLTVGGVNLALHRWEQSLSKARGEGAGGVAGGAA